MSEETAPQSGPLTSATSSPSPVAASNNSPADSPTKTTQSDVFRRLVTLIRQQVHLARDPSEALYWYDNGVYRPGAEARLADFVVRHMESVGMLGLWTPSLSTRILEFFRRDIPYLAPPPPDKIVLLNGILHLPSLRFTEHDPEIYTTVQIPIRYTPDAICPAWDTFLKKVMPSGAVEFALEVMGYLLVPSRTSQCVIWLHGSGSNGKSTFLEAVQRFVGMNNVAGVPLHQLNTSRFSAVELYGKLLNVDSDVEGRTWQESAMFKRITGGDEIWADRKNRAPITFRPFCRLLLSGNTLPRTIDKSFGMLRRFLILPFPREIAVEDRRDQDEMLEELTAPWELSGVLNKAIQGLLQMREAKRFTIPEAVQQATKEFVEITDPMYQFATEFLKNKSDGEFTTKDEVYNAYVEWVMTQDRPQLPHQTVISWLNRHHKVFRSCRPRTGGRKRGFILWPSLADWGRLDSWTDLGPLEDDDDGESGSGSIN